MADKLTEKNANSPSKRYAQILFAIWTIVIVASIGLNIWQVRTNVLETAKIQARVAYEKDVIYRRWNASHGGVYVPATEETQPNPYLVDIVDRDIITPSGLLLTLVNPAYMTRQVHELYESGTGVLGHITSLKPIRPENAADEWETQALQAFERGETEISSIEIIGEVEYLRLMRPLIAEQNCLKCHEQQGYKLGDIRGGISVAVLMEPVWAIFKNQISAIWFGHLFFWFIGISGIFFANIRFARSDLERQKGERALKALASTFTALTGDELFENVSRHLVESLNVDYAFVGELSDDSRRVRVVGGFGKNQKLEPFTYDLIGTPCETVIGQEPCYYPANIQTLFPEDHLLVEMDVQAYIGHPIFDSNGEPLGIIALLHGQPLLEKSLALSMVQIFSERISAEIERARTEADILQARREWQGIFQAIGHPTMILDPSHTILDANLATEQVFAKPRSELIGEKCYVIFHGKSEPVLCCPMDDMEFEQVRIGEMLVEALNGTYLVSCTPIFDGNGRVEKIIHIATDITEWKLAEANLKESEQQYIQLNEQLEQMVVERTEELQTTINLMAGREVRIAELKKVIKKLRGQLHEAGLKPVADDPLLEDSKSLGM